MENLSAIYLHKHVFENLSETGVVPLAPIVNFPVSPWNGAVLHDLISVGSPKWIMSIVTNHNLSCRKRRYC